MAAGDIPLSHPVIQPLGDQGLIVRFAFTLGDVANRAAIAFARRLEQDRPSGLNEIDPNLVSVLLKYDPTSTSFERLAGEVRLRLGDEIGELTPGARHTVAVRFGRDDGPDLAAVAEALGLTPDGFVARHCTAPLRVLTTGFAPGFVYCGFHPEELVLPRRTEVRPSVPAGTILFAAGQTAITATAVPTGWHVIGRSDFRNFDPDTQPPTRLREGDEITFEAVG